MRAVTLVILAAFLVACGRTAADRERVQTNANQNQLIQAQPIPKFDWSAQRDSLIQIYQLSNEARNTWTVIVSDMGTPMWSCPSVGFPIPGGTQLTNPLQATAGGPIALAEPNGLYTDPNTNSTWILCVREGGEVVPVYSEPKALAFPFPVEVKDGKIVEVKGGKSTATVTLSKRA